MTQDRGDRLDRIEALLEQTATRVNQIAQQQEQLTQQQQQLATRFDSLVSETQRLFNRLADGQTRTEASVDSLTDAVARLTQNSEADRVRWRETQADIQRIWEYLLRQSGNGRGDS